MGDAVGRNATVEYLRTTVGIHSFIPSSAPGKAVVWTSVHFVCNAVFVDMGGGGGVNSSTAFSTGPRMCRNRGLFGCFYLLDSLGSVGDGV